MKSDAAPTHYTEHGLGFSDGTELPADIIVFATGFDLNIRNRVRDAFGEDVAKEIGDFSVMDDEGEMSGAWRFQRMVNDGISPGLCALTLCRSWTGLSRGGNWPIKVVLKISCFDYESGFDGNTIKSVYGDSVSTKEDRRHRLLATELRKRKPVLR